MEDREIVRLYFARDEQALSQTQRKYGGYCRVIAFRLLGDVQDAEECVNDLYLAAWNSIPPHSPARLSTYLGKLLRRICTDRIRHRTAQKRGAGELVPLLEELSECLAHPDTVDSLLDEQALVQTIRAFLDGLPPIQRRIFLCRYWHGEEISVIAARFHFSQSKIKSLLLRLRQRLKQQLRQEGYYEI